MPCLSSGSNFCGVPAIPLVFRVPLFRRSAGVPCSGVPGYIVCREQGMCLEKQVWQMSREDVLNAMHLAEYLQNFAGHVAVI